MESSTLHHPITAQVSLLWPFKFDIGVLHHALFCITRPGVSNDIPYEPFELTAEVLVYLPALDRVTRYELGLEVLQRIVDSQRI